MQPGVWVLASFKIQFIISNETEVWLGKLYTLKFQALRACADFQWIS